MNFDFSDDQKMVQDQARAYLSDKASMAVVRDVLESEKTHDASVWQGIVELGWQGLSIPESYGGLRAEGGMGYLELCVIAEELGRSLAPVPFSSSVYLATEAVLAAASEEQKQRLLPGLAAGEVIATLATAEALGNVSAALPGCEVKNGALNGKKIAVPDGSHAAVAVVLASDGSDSHLYWVDLNHSGVSRVTQESVDPSRDMAALAFDAVPAERLESSASGFALVEEIYDAAAVLFAFEQVGGSQAALDMAREYTMQRYAFGRPIASFQALKHKMADMFVAIELARSNAYYGAWALSTRAPEFAAAAATARISAVDAFFECSKENMQAHGGMGYTWELDCHLYYRRAQLLAVALGGQRDWKNLLVTRMRAA